MWIGLVFIDMAPCLL